MKLMDYVKKDSVLSSPKNVLTTTAVVIGYGMLNHPDTPDWTMNLLVTLMWIHVVLAIITAFAATAMAAMFKKTVADAEFEQKERLDKLLYRPNIVARLVAAYVVVMLYMSDHTVAGVLYILASLFLFGSLVGMRKTMDQMVMDRLSGRDQE